MEATAQLIALTGGMPVNDQLQGFFEDLVVLLREKYNQAHDDSEKATNEGDKAFWKTLS